MLLPHDKVEKINLQLLLNGLVNILIYSASLLYQVKLGDPHNDNYTVL